MKIKKIITITFLVLPLFYGCITKNPKSTNYQNINKNLFLEIDKFVLMVDSIPRSRELQNVILVEFNKSNDSLFININTSYYYPDSIDGYFFTDYYMIAFYNSSLWPDKKLLDEYPKIEIPQKYESESQVHFSAFEPRIKKYLYVKPDSLKLIKYIIY